MKKLLLATAACCIVLNGANACGGTAMPKACYSRVYDAAHLAKHPEQTVSAIRMAPSDAFDFDLDIQFRGDKDKWAWKVSGVCDDFGPGLTCGVILDGCEPWGGAINHFYITYDKNRTSLYLYPKKIPLEIISDKLSDDSKIRFFTEGKDDKVFRLDKTACWQENKK
jgi:hypothetical protein